MTITVHGYKVDIEAVERIGDEEYQWYYAWYDCKWRKAKLNYCEWTKRAHGNPPGGVKIYSYRITLPDGSRHTISEYT